jgi:putative phosphotransacetylase
MKEILPIEVSARHIHLSQEHIDLLFGKGYALTKLKNITNSTNFAANETLSVCGIKHSLLDVRIVGPARNDSIVELSMTDAINIGAEHYVRLINNCQSVEVPFKIPAPHIHCGNDHATELGLKDGDFIEVKTMSPLPVTFHNVKVRVSNNYSCIIHLDTDEGNAAGISKQGKGELLWREQSIQKLE